MATAASPMRTDAAAFDPEFYRKLRTLLGRMTARGFQPVVISGWRDLAEQARLKAAGYSEVSFSFHNNIDNSGRPAALAADIKDRREGWVATPGALAFYRTLGVEAKALGLSWGGDYSKRDDQWGKNGLGWDPGHVQALSNDALAAVRNRAQGIAAALEAGDVSEAASVATRLPGMGALMRKRVGPIPLWALGGILGLGVIAWVVAIVRRR